MRFSTVSLAFSLLLASCATTVPEIEVREKSVASNVQVRPISKPSESLFAIEDPLTLAIEARWNSDFEKAYEYFSEALIATPRNSEVIAGFADMAIRTGRYNAAHSAFAKLDIDPNTSKPALVSGLVLAEIASGQSPDPELRLNQALERDPSDPRLWNALGHFHDSHGQPLRAQDAYIKALSTGRADASVINNLGMSFLMQGQKKAALSKFQQASEIDPESKLYDNNRRLTLALLKDYEAAVENLDEETYANILNDAGFIAKKRGETSLAKELFSAAISASPRHHPKAVANLEKLASATE